MLTVSQARSVYSATSMEEADRLTEGSIEDVFKRKLIERALAKMKRVVRRKADLKSFQWRMASYEETETKPRWLVADLFG